MMQATAPRAITPGIVRRDVVPSPFEDTDCPACRALRSTVISQQDGEDTLLCRRHEFYRLAYEAAGGEGYMSRIPYADVAALIPGWQDAQGELVDGEVRATNPFIDFAVIGRLARGLRAAR